MGGLPIAIKLSPNYNRRREVVKGICLHWSSGSFPSTIDWTCSAKSKVSYHAVIGPKGQITQTVPWNGRAWAMGYCRETNPDKLPYHDANNVFESIALSGGPPVAPTPAQVETVIALCVERFRAHGWGAAETWRITTHQAEAVYGPDAGKLAGHRGRKIDPEGTKPDHKWLDCDHVREEVARRLGMK